MEPENVFFYGLVLVAAGWIFGIMSLLFFPSWVLPDSTDRTLDLEANVRYAEELQQNRDRWVP